ncbi:MAG TPA: CoA transferase, partial [Paraburkholderia sp.]
LDALAQNERYDTVRKRAQHRDEIVPQLHAALQTRSALEWEAHFGDAVPCAAARSIEDMFDDPQVLAQDLVGSFEYPGVGRYRGFKHPIRFGATPGPESVAAPAFGEHSDQVLSASGWTDAEIEALRAKRAVL